LASDPARGSLYYSGYARLPDEWNGGISLTPLHPRARKLQWVEGDLMAYRRCRPARVEIPLPLAGDSVRREVGGVIIRVSRYRPVIDQEGSAEDDLPLQRPFVQPDQPGFSVRVQVYVPRDARVGSAYYDGGIGSPVAEGESGRAYGGMLSRSSGR